MPIFIKLLKGIQLNLEAVKTIEDTAAWLTVNIPQTIQANSQEIIKEKNLAR